MLNNRIEKDHPTNDYAIFYLASTKVRVIRPHFSGVIELRLGMYIGRLKS